MAAPSSINSLQVPSSFPSTESTSIKKAKDSENSTFKKMLVAIPIIGDCFQWYYQEGRLAGKIEYAETPKRKIELLKLKKEYQSIGLTKDLAIWIGLIALTVLGIISFGSAWGAVLFFALTGYFVIGRQSRELKKTEKQIEGLRV